jgi:hypothetical protein
VLFDPLAASQSHDQGFIQAPRMAEVDVLYTAILAQPGLS